MSTPSSHPASAPTPGFHSSLGKAGPTTVKHLETLPSSKGLDLREQRRPREGRWRGLDAQSRLWVLGLDLSLEEQADWSQVERKALWAEGVEWVRVQQLSLTFTPGGSAKSFQTY